MRNAKTSVETSSLHRPQEPLGWEILVPHRQHKIDQLIDLELSVAARACILSQLSNTLHFFLQHVVIVAN